MSKERQIEQWLFFIDSLNEDIQLAKEVLKCFPFHKKDHLNRCIKHKKNAIVKLRNLGYTKRIK